METLQQKMALSALAQVQAFKSASSPDEREKYRTMALKLPVLILTDGLAQALTFVEARGEAPQLLLLNDVAKTVDWHTAQTGPALAARSRTAELSEYMVLTRRVLGALVWYKRFVESVLVRPQENEEKAGVQGGAVDD